MKPIILVPPTESPGHWLISQEADSQFLSIAWLEDGEGEPAKVFKIIKDDGDDKT